VDNDEVINTLLGWLRRPSPPVEERQAVSLPVIRQISNADLTEADIPGEDYDWNDWSGVCAFAASFNGYQYWGSLCFEVVHLHHTRGLSPLTLTELRTSLPFTRG